MGDKDLWSEVDQPMEPPDGLKSRLVDAMRASAAAVEDEFALMEGLDSPRPLRSDAVGRLATTIVRKGKLRSTGLRALVAVAAVMTLIASAVYMSSDRFGRNDPTQTLAGDVALLSFASGEEFQRYMSSLANVGVSARLSHLEAQVSKVSRGEAVQEFAPSSGALSASRPAEDAVGGGAGGDFSTTNVQEMGVDEPDLIKTDGTVLAAVASGKLWILDVTGDQPVVKGTLQFPRPPSTVRPDLPGVSDMALPIDGWIDDGQLFLHGSNVIHIAHNHHMRAETKVTVISIADPSKPTMTSEMTLEGSMVGARMSGGSVRLVLRSHPGPDLEQPRAQSEQEYKKLMEENKRIIEQAPPEEWLPEFELKVTGDDPVEGKIHSWTEVKRPKEFSGTSMLSVVTIDPSNPSPQNSVSIVGAGEIVYSSTENLYVTTQKDTGGIVIVPRGELGRDLPPGVKAVAPEDFKVTTQIHKFSISAPGAAVYQASGEIEGTVLNQFSLSERDGFLRVATTKPQLTEAAPSESFVTILQQQDKKMIAVGSVGDLGKGEQIYAVRFIGDQGYVVTFRQTDPLYVIDLKDPRSPSIKGELKIPGFSNYLHPVGEDLLLGIGQDADDQGRVKGLQVSLFDVKDSSSPKRLHQKSLGGFGSSSQAQFDHHAFLYWPATGLLVIPIHSWDEGGTPNGSAMALTVDRQGFSEPTEISHPRSVNSSGGDLHGLEFKPQILRSIVMRKDLLTYSSAGLMAHDLSALTQKSWLPFGTS